MKKMRSVPKKEDILGLDTLVNAWTSALHLLGFVMRKWTKQINDPSNSIPYSDVNVTGLNKFQKIYYEVFATMNSEIPDPNP